MDWNHHCFLTVHWNILAHPCHSPPGFSISRVNPQSHRSFPILQSPYLYVSILPPYLSFHQLLRTPSVGTSSTLALILCLLVVHSPSPVKVMQYSFHLFPTSSSHSTCPLSLYIFPTTLLPFRLGFNLCPKAFLVVQEVFLQSFTNFHSLLNHSYHSSLFDLPPFLSLGTLSLHLQTSLAATSSMPLSTANSTSLLHHAVLFSFPHYFLPHTTSATSALLNTFLAASTLSPFTYFASLILWSTLE